MCLIFHDWSKWEQYTKRGKVMYSGFLTPIAQRGKWIEFEKERQRRKCKRCGKMQDVEL